ncbi:MAG: Fic family protein [Methanosarcinales archaeon]|nr:Fic family protein [Methanosarcinales archaeon]
MSLKQKYKKAEDNNNKLSNLRPLPEETLKSLKAYYRVGLTYSSNALEGNSLTESETKIVIEDGLTINGKPLRDIYEAVGHAKAYDYLWELAVNKLLKEEDILLLHRFFYEMIDSDQAGIYRKIPVFISGGEFPVTPADKIKQEMKNFVKWFNQSENQLQPVEFAALVHKKFVFIHPFIDGNGRLARLLMNLALIRNEYSVALIPSILRPEYIRSLELAHTNDEPFKEFIADRAIETQKDLLRLFKKTSKEIDSAGGEKLGGVNSGKFSGAGVERHGGVNCEEFGGADVGRHGGVNCEEFGGVGVERHGGVNCEEFSGADVGRHGDIIREEFGGVNYEEFGGAGIGGLDDSNPLPGMIFELIQTSPGLNAPKIAENCGIGLRTAQRYLKLLADNGQIEFIGAPKIGGYCPKTEKII